MAIFKAVQLNHFVGLGDRWVCSSCNQQFDHRHFPQTKLGLYDTDSSPSFCPECGEKNEEYSFVQKMDESLAD
jgi:rubrerythrin